ncbi:MAG: FAD-binding oxidoreductase [Chloroflexi bacterium]|nr:FAD-binding oxidoreductase [Chloroflexota bacterium]
MTVTSPLDAVRHALPSDTEREPHDYAIDGLLPRVAFSPDDRREVAELLRTAARHDLVVVPQGGRTALALGRPVDRYDVALDTRGLRRLVEYVPDDLTITAEAGISLRHLQDALGEHGQYLPVDPPPDDRVTLGGLLATARPGAWRGFTPGVRDLILGMTVALPDGLLARSGGRVVKNVSGYDLHRLHTGALGAFGVIVEASLKLAPLPVATRSLALRCGDLARAVRVGLALRDAPLSLRGLAVIAPRASAHASLPHEPHALVDLAGVEEAVVRSAREVDEVARRHGATPAEVGERPWQRLRALAGDESATVVRLGVPATATLEVVEEVRAVGCLAWAYPASGIVMGHADAGLQAGAVSALRDRARALGGYLQVEAASPELRRRVDPFDVDEREAVERLKAQFDPGHVINRGRWMEGL